MTEICNGRKMGSQRQQIFLSFFLERLKPDDFSCDVDPMDAL